MTRLDHLAQLKGIALEYNDVWGHVHHAEPDVLVNLLGAMHVAEPHVGSAEELARIGVEAAAAFDLHTGLPLTIRTVELRGSYAQFVFAFPGGPDDTILAALEGIVEWVWGLRLIAEPEPEFPEPTRGLDPEPTPAPTDPRALRPEHYLWTGATSVQ